MSLTYKDLNEIEEVVRKVVKEETKHLPSKDDFYTRMDKLSGEYKSFLEESEILRAKIDRVNKRVAT